MEGTDDLAVAAVDDERHPAQRFTPDQEAYASAVINAGETLNLVPVLAKFDGEPVTLLCADLGPEEYVPVAILLDAKHLHARLTPPEGVEVIPRATAADVDEDA